MRIAYAFHGRFPDPRAAALFAAQEAVSFSEFAEVEIIVPARDTTDLKLARTQFHIPAAIKIRALPVTDLFNIPLLRRFTFPVSLYTFSRSLRRYLKNEGKSVDWVVTADHLVALAAKKAGKRVMLEIHDFPGAHASLWRRALARADLVLATNEWKKAELIRQFNLAPTKVVMERNGVDLTLFDTVGSKEAARAKFALPTGPLVVYTGQLFGWKGVDTLARAAKLLPEVSFCLVGGSEKAIEDFKRDYTPSVNVHFAGQRPYDEIPYFQVAADILALPNTAREAISSRYTSPMKLFQYMASGTPIVATRLLSIEEIISDETAYLVPPDDAAAFAEAITQILKAPVEAAKRAEVAKRAVAPQALPLRAKRLVDLMSP